MFAADAKFGAEQFGETQGAGDAAIGNAENDLTRQLRGGQIGAVFEKNKFVAVANNGDFCDPARYFYVYYRRHARHRAARAHLLLYTMHNVARVVVVVVVVAVWWNWAKLRPAAAFQAALVAQRRRENAAVRGETEGIDAVDRAAALRK